MSDQRELQAGWTKSQLSAVCTHLTDGSHLPPPKQDIGFPMLSATNIDNNRITLDGRLISESSFLAEDKRTRIQCGDVLLTIVGTIGRSAVVPNGMPKFTLQRSVAVFRSTILDPKFLSYQFQSQAFQKKLQQQARGTAQKGVYLTLLRGLDVLIAPLNEQRRIVAKIEELFSDLDAGVAALKRAKANLKRYRASVLKAAVEGKLTEEWRAKHPAKEPASELLARILKERREKWESDQLAKFAATGKQPPKNWRDKYVEPSPPETDGLPELPQGWCWASVEQLSVVIRGSSPRPAGDPRYFGGPIPWITVGSLTSNDDPYLKSVTEGLTEAGREASRWIEPDTLLLTNSGATLGVPKITMIGGCINDGSVALLNVDYPLKLYLYYFLKSQTERLRNINQGAAQPNLNTGIVKAITVPLCPLQEQQQIVSEVAERSSQIDAAELQIEHGLLRAARLRQSILKRAFEGKLVPQDPSDEPASVLLERLRASRSHEGAKDKPATGNRTLKTSPKSK